MKISTAALIAMFAVSPLVASVASAAPIQDKDGFMVHLDVAKVISDTTSVHGCGIQPARLDYLDHSGREHVLNYKVEGMGCQNDE